MEYLDGRYFELSGLIASRVSFCEFLNSGGRVMKPGIDAGWRDVTAEVLAIEWQKIDELERRRSALFPNFEIDGTDRLTTH
jgi:hypothetical protein